MFVLFENQEGDHFSGGSEGDRFPGGCKESAYNGGSLGLIPGLVISLGEGHDNPLQYSCLENPHRREELGRIQSMGSQSWTQLSD